MADGAYNLDFSTLTAPAYTYIPALFTQKDCCPEGEETSSSEFPGL